MKAFFIKFWRVLIGVCSSCGGRLNQVSGFGPHHAMTMSGIYVWCPSCHMSCTDPVCEKERRLE